MSNQRPAKIAFIGSHGVGKTTLVYGLASRLKALDVSLEVVVEVARRCPLPINEETSLAAQSWILHTQIADETLAAARYPVVVCDRSVLDNFVYMLLAAGPQPAAEAFLHHWLPTYDLMIHVPILESEVRADGVRSTDRNFQSVVEERLMQELRQRDLPFFSLEGEDRDDWARQAEEMALSRVLPNQLRLLP